ncbi:MAG: protein-L-isoaspartate(D-aspartate) O-methyltransferase [Deltaproteobacteria bacterium]|nr:protein-L-isoaspartate(D-aspartate) O-methyltransferase [Deltaproteobacteria bacterium]
MDFSIARRNMVERHLKARGITDQLVLETMLQVPRHLFVEGALQSQAYSDYPLPIGEGQTISQPYIVALMTASLALKGKERVLEIGTGSGYQAAVLASIVSKVYSIERNANLARRARLIFDRTGIRNVIVKVGDGCLGWEEESPFDGILVTAGAPAVVDTLKYQLAVGGRLIIPVGPGREQVLKCLTRSGENEFQEEDLVRCRFVPLVGQYGWKDANSS